MEKINKFESIRTIKVIGVMTGIIFFISTAFYIFNAVLLKGNILSSFLPAAFMVLGVIMFKKPVRRIFFFYISIFFIYFILNIGLVIFISGYEYIGQIIFEAVFLVYFIIRYVKIREIEVTGEDIREYDESSSAFDRHDFFYVTVTNFIESVRWTCTVYDGFFLVKKKYRFNKILIEKRQLKFDFNNVNSRLLIGYIIYNNKKEMCRMKKNEYDAYQKLLKID